MKVNILTLPFNDNFGGVLQNFALQIVLHDMGHQPVTVLRLHNGPGLRGRFVRVLSCIKRNILHNVLRKDTFSTYTLTGLHSINFLKQYSTYPFISRHIRLAGPVESDKAMARYGRHHRDEAWIVGSDQTWRPEYCPSMPNYFLDFLCRPQIAVAYAASFGSAKCHIPASALARCRESISNFTALSVREESAKEILREQFGAEATQVLDPTLLLTADDYLSLLQIESSDSSQLMTAYILDPAPNKSQLTREIAEAMNLTEISEIGLSDRVGVEQWLSAIASAQFVVTDSFHGCVFSIIFRKPFIAIANHERGLDRFISLLRPLGLMDRLIDENDAIDMQAFLRPVDHDTVGVRLDELRRRSMEFLRRSLEPKTAN
ncbi:MAG: polysaccharide pyruvyl transferase family protein [Bacteroides sp.]|nr:polysaccharide pyruvyl transferase family protein [Bacteroides sp.]MCM1413235.1 polysaccharide pyruvyl transferase family protein [Bacteroides sp.]MCM1471455.1 polysaccharide pyruvyl transferase family protein [Bacteroides sp.]